MKKQNLWSSRVHSDSMLLTLAYLSASMISGCGSQPSQQTVKAPPATDSQTDVARTYEEQSTAEGGGIQSAPAADGSSTKPNATQVSTDAFLMAAYNGRLETVRDALESGSDVNATGGDRSLTALHMAAYNGHSETVKFLIEKGATIDCRDFEGKTPLIHACTGPFAETVEILAEAGADLNAKESTESFTPLMMAAGLGQHEVVEVLLRKGADKTVRDQDNDQAIDHARNSGHDKIVKMLE